MILCQGYGGNDDDDTRSGVGLSPSSCADLKESALSPASRQRSNECRTSRHRHHAMEGGLLSIRRESQVRAQSPEKRTGMFGVRVATNTGVDRKSPSQIREGVKNRMD